MELPTNRENFVRITQVIRSCEALIFLNFVNLQYREPNLPSPHRWAKFGVDYSTISRHDRAKFTPPPCNMSPLRHQEVAKWMSNLCTGVCSVVINYAGNDDRCLSFVIFTISKNVAKWIDTMNTFDSVVMSLGRPRPVSKTVELPVRHRYDTIDHFQRALKKQTELC